MVELTIYNKNIYYPLVEGKIKLDFERQGVPGKLTFNVVKDEILNFEEGNCVCLKVDNANVFKGYVFSKKRSKEQIISVTAYDQLRYLKNKDTMFYENFKASDLLRKIAENFSLETGSIDDTEYVIESKIEDNTTLFDMIQNALDATLTNKKKMYVLYDDFGKLCLKNIENMKISAPIDESSAEDFDYETSIDSNTYNQVKLAYDNKDTKKREIYIERDSNNIGKWGLLQFFEKINNTENAVSKAQALLELYNTKTKTLSIKNIMGDTRVRAGSSIIVKLNLGDSSLNNYMVVEKVQHEFSGDGHFMSVDLIGGGFYA